MIAKMTKGYQQLHTNWEIVNEFRNSVLLWRFDNILARAETKNGYPTNRTAILKLNSAIGTLESSLLVLNDLYEVRGSIFPLTNYLC